MSAANVTHCFVANTKLLGEQFVANSAGVQAPHFTDLFISQFLPRIFQEPHRRSVSNTVAHVFGVRTPAKVVQSAISRVAVKVSAFLAGLWLADERKQNERVNGSGAFLPAIGNDANGWVSKLVSVLPQSSPMACHYATAATGPATPDRSEIANAVSGCIWNVPELKDIIGRRHESAPRKSVCVQKRPMSNDRRSLRHFTMTSGNYKGVLA